MNPVAHLPLVFHDQQAVVDRDPQALAHKLNQHFPVREFAPRLSESQPFLHRASTASAGALTLTCGYTCPIVGTIGDNPGVGAINICYSGAASYAVDGHSFAIHSESPLYFNPGLEYRYATDHYNGLVLHVDLQRLQDTAAAIGGVGLSGRRFAPDLQRPQVLTMAQGRQAELLQSLRRAFALVDAPELEAAGELTALQLDDLIYRILALALCPQLERQTGRSQQRSEGLSRELIFEELLEWIQANLHAPINLTQLEQRSGYSRRNLQLAFSQRFGCGPIQWIRRQRLDLARHHLLNPSASDSVAAISARLGFRNISAFSRDFHSVYGIRPSDVLREGRRLHG
ncbi:AraC family transcriptional regulator [Cyanobium sp. FACHB-13342]|uniref:AraC family transcriptional regulator n=1 Tax=Cyanobium sp. FACHB-13342 TaxID=2692793 RepID=UPI001680BA67|nr:AraC family transcriptional regulator [Cyanobium sp. FACHB-13342]MBD2422146.1 helix-turn-helix transcriptional regulator [Cyanobium sp. FACHB-13342]